MEASDYLERLGAAKPARPDLETLQLLQLRHLETVPFENLDIHQGVPIVLDELALLRKIVLRRRGGFCYELNGAFAWLLRKLGYAVTLLSGEVRGADGGWGIPFDHMTLRVELDRPYLVDVGFGDSARAPLAFDGPPVVEPWGDRFGVTREGDWLFMERGGRESDFERRYRFSLDPRELADFRGGCEYHQESPESPFTARALVTRALPEGRVTLLPDRLIETHRGEKSESDVKDRAQWLAALRTHFDIALS